MHWINLLWAILIYSASFLPMIQARRTSDTTERIYLFLFDFFLTIVAYVYLWNAFSSTYTSLAVVLIVMATQGFISAVFRNRGYDPYEFVRNKS